MPIDDPDTSRQLPDRPNLRHLKDQAKDLLKRYLNSPLTPEDPPRADAEKLLKQAEGS